ncbi:hypothetical protein P43SY_001483 [Pythium insidiosum]|uniref:Uncharacterized protein n=1 Tax=Pythium insidiosum TaxID=114742 RepID=A0AAD5LKU5_PYTIN|nr:hypothetical protein P43SY_001483 [Pythium insidiosum]
MASPWLEALALSDLEPLVEIFGSADAVPVAPCNAKPTSASPTLVHEDIHDAGAGGSSSSTESTSQEEDPVVAAVATTQSGRKKRKSTYYARKEETAALQIEAKQLEAQLEQLVNSQRARRDEVSRVLLAHALMTNDVKQNDISLAGLRALLNQQTLQREGNALECFISLPADLQQRRDVMMSLKDKKLLDGREFLDEYTQCLNARRSHRDVQLFDTEDGDYVCNQFDITMFPEAKSVRQAFDGLVHFFLNQEVSVTATLGVLTIRESDDCSESTVSQCRILQALPGGVEIENNSVMWLHFHEDPLDPEKTYGLVVADYVNEDALYPYRPTERIREDLSAVALIRAYPRDDGSLMVSMTRWGFVRMRCPQFAISDDVSRIARDAIARFSDIIVDAMRDYMTQP